MRKSGLKVNCNSVVFAFHDCLLKLIFSLILMINFLNFILEIAELESSVILPSFLQQI